MKEDAHSDFFLISNLNILFCTLLFEKTTSPVGKAHFCLIFLSA